MKRYLFPGLITAVFLISAMVVFPAGAAQDRLIQAAKKEKSVTVYHSMGRGPLKALSKRFEKKFGIKVNWTRKGTGGITRMFEAEKLAGVLKCDIVSVGDPSTFIRWSNENVLTSFVSSNNPAFLKGLADPKGFSIPGRAAYVSIGYNTKKVSKSEAPKSWKDVLDPKWKGRIASIDPRKSGPARLWVAAMVQKFGWDYFKKLAKNKPLMLKSFSTSAVALVSGEADIVIPGNEGDILKRRVKGEPVDNVYPKEGLLFRTGRTGICKSSPHPNAAKLWIEFEGSREGQTLLNRVRGYVPTRSDVNLKHPRPAEAIKPENMLYVDDAWFLKNKKKMIKKFTRIMSGRG